MAKRHWLRNGNMACPTKQTSDSRLYGITAERFVARFRTDPDRFCTLCAKAARLALAKEQPVAVSFSSTVRRCSRCRSGAINPSDHGRTEGADLDLCDVCYWRKRAFDPLPISAAREDEILGYCPGIGWRRLSRVAWRRWGLTGAEHIADYEPTHFLPLLPEVM